MQYNVDAAVVLYYLCYAPMQMLKCIEVDEKLKSMDQEITVNPQFVQKVPV